MPVSDEYLAYIHERLEFLSDVRIRKMFGGAMVYNDNLPFALVADDILYFRVGKNNRSDFEHAQAGMFKPDPYKPMTMPYGEVPGEVIEDGDLLRKWTTAAIAAARAVKK